MSYMRGGDEARDQGARLHVHVSCVRLWSVHPIHGGPRTQVAERSGRRRRRVCFGVALNCSQVTCSWCNTGLYQYSRPVPRLYTVKRTTCVVTHATYLA